jgi:hypothetical protein
MGETTIPSGSAASPAEGRTERTVVLPGQTPGGQHILGVLVKRTYTIVPGKRCVRANKDFRLIPGDEHYGDPMNSTVKYETDFIPFKVATDVVLHGNAFAPGGRPTQALTASLSVGQFRKEVRVIGDRVCRYRAGADPQFTDPEPFQKMELRYERSYGGVDVYSDKKTPCAYPRNHLGRGFVVGTDKKAVDNLPLPNLEDPQDMLTPSRLSCGQVKNWERQPMPQGFGWFSMYWQPRASLAGVLPADRPLEQQMRQAYAQLLPPDERKLYEENPLPDMDFRFFNGASAGLTLPFLSGEEEVRLTNLTPEGDLSFRLPGERPGIGLDVGEGMREPPVFLHTVMIRLEDRQVDLVWRAAVPYPGPDWLPQMPKGELVIR